MQKKIPSYWSWGHSLTASNDAQIPSLPRSVCFSNDPKWSIFEQEIGPDKVCIFVNMGPF